MPIQNIALNKPTTASSYVKPYAPSRAVDGTYTTPVNRWLCNGVSSASPSRLIVDLGYLSVITKWVVRHMSVAGWKSPDYNMCDFKLQASLDNNTWVDIDSVAGNTSGITDRNIAGLVVYRYVRLYVTKGLLTNPQIASLMEFEVYGQATPYLSGLSISSGVLSPSFSPQVYSYTSSNVPYSTSSTNITAITQDPNARIKINNTLVENGVPSPVTLSVGSNTINVVVTAADGVATQAYTVTVVRDQASADLSSLSAMAGTTELITGFNKDTTTYNVNVGYDSESAVITPVAVEPSATITVNGQALSGGKVTVNLNVGPNAIAVVVSNGETTKTYTVNVMRASSPYLSNLTITPVLIKLSPTFSSPTLNYTTKPATVTSGSISLTPTAQDTSATINIGGTVVPSGTAKSITLSSGLNTINIIVASAAGSDSKTYVLQVTKS